MKSLEKFIGFTVATPEAQKLPFDPFSEETLDWSLLYPQNYFSVEYLQELEATGTGFPILTPSMVCIEVVQDDPERPDPNKAPDLVMKFTETDTKLVLNKTRCKLISHIAQTRDFRAWTTRLPRLKITYGVVSQMSKAAQVLVSPIFEDEPDFDRPTNLKTATQFAEQTRKYSGYNSPNVRPKQSTFRPKQGDKMKKQTARRIQKEMERLKAVKGIIPIYEWLMELDPDEDTSIGDLMLLWHEEFDDIVRVDTRSDGHVEIAGIFWESLEQAGLEATPTNIRGLKDVMIKMKWRVIDHDGQLLWPEDYL